MISNALLPSCTRLAASRYGRTALQSFSTKDSGLAAAAKGALSSKEIIFKGDVTDYIAETHDLSQAKSKRIVDSIFDVFSSKLKEGKTIRIHGFGIIKSYQAASRKGTNPTTNTPIIIPARKRVRFKASKTLKDFLNK